ncbi:MAG: hypothetical protein ACI4WU_02655 [Bacilli bacterium]
MKEFIKKWQSDKRFQTKIKLLLYTVFIVIVAIYAISLDNSSIDTLDQDIIDEINNEGSSSKNIIDIKDNYHYVANVNIDDSEYQYTIIKKDNQETITKEHNNITSNYLYKNNNYYQLQDDTYVLTTKDNIYDVINENYLNLSSINKYLEKSQKNNNQYLVYLKDIILEDSSEDYFVILINKNKISIDYTPLMKHFNSSLKKINVDITIIDGLNQNIEE